MPSKSKNNLSNAEAESYSPPKSKKVYGFVTSEHASVISTVCKEKNYAVTIRATGLYTLERIRRGHPCKPHHIYDKSIKEGSLKGNVIAKLDLKKADFIKIEEDTFEHIKLCQWDPIVSIEAKNNFIKSAMSNPSNMTRALVVLTSMAGLVGNWEDDDDENRIPKYRKKLVGLKNADGSNWNFSDHTIQLKKTRVTFPHKKEKVVSADIPRQIYTGDYDMHDLIYNKTRTVSMSEDGAIVNSDGAGKFINEVNTRIDRFKNIGHSEIQGVDPKDYNVVQHGPQHAYGGFALSRGEDLVLSLLGTDLPLLGFDQSGTIDFIETISDLVKWYQKIGASIPPWRLHSAADWMKHKWYGINIALRKDNLEQKKADCMKLALLELSREEEADFKFKDENVPFPTTAKYQQMRNKYISQFRAQLNTHLKELKEYKKVKATV